MARQRFKHKNCICLQCPHSPLLCIVPALGLDQISPLAEITAHGGEPPNRKTCRCFQFECIPQTGNWGYVTFSLGHRNLQPQKSLCSGLVWKRGWGWGELQGPAKVEPSTWGHEVNIENRVRNLPSTSVKQPNHHEGAESAASLWLESQPQTRQVVLRDVG